MTVYRCIFRLAFLCVSLATLSMSTASARQSQIPVSDLGTREQGQVYPLKLTAVNVDCDSAQNFEFQIDSTPWLVTPDGATVPGLGPGQSRSISAQLDFTYMPPGVYYGHVTARCTSCGWFIFAACVENGQDVVLKVKVADPADPTNGANIPEPPNPYADLQPYQPPLIPLNPQISTQDVNVLNRPQREKLLRARAAVDRAKRQGERARDDLRNAGKKKSDCERELARLKAALAAAQRKLAIAVQDAKNAAAAAKAAAKQLKDFDKDRRKAEKTKERTDYEARVMIKYIGDFCKGGVESRKCKNFRRQVSEYQTKADAAKEAHDKISKSQAARKKTAEKAIADAAAANRNVQTANGSVRSAKVAYDAKLRECAGLGSALSNAQAAMEQAKKDAEDAVKDANKEEEKAAKAAAEKLDDLIKKKKKQCIAMRKLMAAEVAKLKYALEIGQKLKVFADDGGKRGNIMTEVNDKIWDAAADETRNKMDPYQADLSSSEGIYNSALSAMSLAADAIGSALGAGGSPSVGQDQMLGGLKALAMAVQGQVAAIRNPNTLAAMRNESSDLRRSEESFQAQKMKDMGIGKNAAERAEIQKTINEIYNKPNLISNLIQRSGAQAARCAAEIKDMEKRQANLRKK